MEIEQHREGPVAVRRVNADRNFSRWPIYFRVVNTGNRYRLSAFILLLQQLNPKPFETLSPEEARKQPTPADAVKSLSSAGPSVSAKHGEMCRL